LGLPGHSPARWVRRDARNSGLRGTYRTHVETEGRLGQMPDGGCLVCRRSLSRPRHRTSELTIQVPERALLVFCFVSVRIFPISISIPSYHRSSAALAAAAKLSLSFFLSSFFPWEKEILRCRLQWLPPSFLSLMLDDVLPQNTRRQLQTPVKDTSCCSP
jgi:hypothetical protein